ncbi:hypothetical protein Nepgr_024271 [Nepenthes gracilis]|uniref:Uncharacterized protein n=1 Tax=Nepenthes gracilis TaxID=150966 RepID=A0AAD3T2J4_NEPGR|nr:hypothetical protein Nepgr_024271 [Nepenthes gracilis]
MNLSSFNRHSKGLTPAYLDFAHNPDRSLSLELSWRRRLSNACAPTVRSKLNNSLPLPVRADFHFDMDRITSQGQHALRERAHESLTGLILGKWAAI